MPITMAHLHLRYFAGTVPGENRRDMLVMLERECLVDVLAIQYELTLALMDLEFRYPE